jgi:signal transduction histidine kinase
MQRPLGESLKNAQFFPPSLVPPASADSLVHVEVSGPNGQPVFESGPTTMLFVGSDTIGAYYGDLIVTAAIAPAAARLLLDGSLPASRAPMIVGLLALALSVGVAAIVLFRREHRLARLREDFVSGVSHELRTPLTQIRMLSELLQTDGFKTDAERARATNVIHREALRLSNLVDNILEFARLRRAPGDSVANRVSLSEIVRELADSFAPLLDAQDNRLELVIPEEMEVPGNRDAVNRVLRNLLENAIKYGPHGQTIRLTLCMSGLPSTVSVMVDDEGSGIPLDERDRVWQPYYRIDRDRNAAAGGSGIGLSVVRDLMRMLGGKAFVTEAPGRGARFVVEFPTMSAVTPHVS